MEDRKHSGLPFSVHKNMYFFLNHFCHCLQKEFVYMIFVMVDKEISYLNEKVFLHTLIMPHERMSRLARGLLKVGAKLLLPALPFIVKYFSLTT